jgi:amphi-Trp domain-containing protein
MAKKDEKWQAKQEAKAAKRAAKAERQQHRRKAQAVLTRGQIADQLRALAAQVESGTVVLGDKELALPEQADFEISYQLRRKGGHEIEVEIEWGGPKQVTLLPTE